MKHSIKYYHGKASDYIITFVAIIIKATDLIFYLVYLSNNIYFLLKRVCCFKIK